MARQPGVESVSAALSDLMDMEAERIDKEAEVRRREAETRCLAREREQALLAEQARLAAEAEEMARRDRKLALEQAFERERREQDLARLEVEKKLEMTERLEAEAIRLRHEEKLARISMSRRRSIPGWVYAAIAATVLVAASATGLVVRELGESARLEREDIKTRSAALLALEEAQNLEQKERIAIIEKAIEDIRARGKDTDEASAEIASLEAVKKDIEDASSPPRPRPRPRPMAASSDPAVSKLSTNYDDPLEGIDSDDASKKKPKKNE